MVNLGFGADTVHRDRLDRRSTVEGEGVLAEWSGDANTGLRVTIERGQATRRRSGTAETVGGTDRSPPVRRGTSPTPT